MKTTGNRSFPSILLILFNRIGQKTKKIFSGTAQNRQYLRVLCGSLRRYAETYGFDLHKDIEFPNIMKLGKT